jgi:glucose/arabinose dehydrogenase
MREGERQVVVCADRGVRIGLLCAGLSLLAFMSGCQRGPTLLRSEEQATIDRTIIEYPAGTELKPYITGLTAPSAIAFDNEGSILIAESGRGGREPRIYGFKKDGTFFDVYPGKGMLPFRVKLPVSIPGTEGFKVYAPIGGMTVAHGKIYVTHRDAEGKGVITAFGYDGSHTTIVADLPAQGDYSVTDIVSGIDGRLHFGVGTATNSAVVGLDNMSWLRQHRHVYDHPWGNLYLLGRRFSTPNPFAGLFGGSDLAVTAPFQAFSESLETQIPAAPNGKPNGAIYSVNPGGGDLQVEAHGIRYPMGLGSSESGRLFFTNQGMKLRGTRPVWEDPDAMLQMVRGQWYGWPDYSANLLPIRDARFKPPEEMLVSTGYRDLSFLIDHEGSALAPPNPSSNLLAATFRPLSGAAKFDFAPASGPFSRLRQAGNVAIVALWGDQAPFDTSGRKLAGPVGYKVVQVNVDDREVTDFIRNTKGGPASMHDDEQWALERPIDIKFGPDGAMYVLDFGYLEMRGQEERVKGGTGRVYRLVAKSSVGG